MKTNNQTLSIFLWALLIIVSVVFVLVVLKKTADLESISTSAQQSKEQPADPKLVEVRGINGLVVQVTDKTITIKNNKNKEEKYNLIQSGLGIFKQSEGKTTFLGLTEIKNGDKVRLEARQSDDVVSAIVVE